jgi:hypothetical protein
MGQKNGFYRHFLPESLLEREGEGGRGEDTAGFNKDTNKTGGLERTLYSPMIKAGKVLLYF